MTSSLRTHLLALACAVSLVACAAQAGTSDVAFFRDVEVDYADGVSALLAKGFDPNTRNAHGQVALTVALQGQSLKVAKVLWEAPGIDLDARNKADETPLMMAALKAEPDAAAALVTRGATVNKSGWTPLHYAATGGNVAIIQLLLAHGAALEARSPNGTTPLMMAARYGSENAVDALLAAGASLKAKNDLGMDAVAFAQSGGRESLTERLKAAAAGH